MVTAVSGTQYSEDPIFNPEAYMNGDSGIVQQTNLVIRALKLQFR